MNILNRTSGTENDMLCSNEITGIAYIAVLALHRFITNVMQKETSEKNQSNGLFLFANHVMTNSIVDKTFPNSCINKATDPFEYPFDNIMASFYYRKVIASDDKSPLTLIE